MGDRADVFVDKHSVALHGYVVTRAPLLCVRYEECLSRLFRPSPDKLIAISLTMDITRRQANLRAKMFAQGPKECGRYLPFFFLQTLKIMA